MSEKFQNKYRIPSARASWWNYGLNAAYFITICTENRVHYFGNVINGEMQLSAIGEIAHQCWHEIPQHFPFVILGEFVAMPNHIHGIIIIDKSDDLKIENSALPNDIPAVQTQYFASPDEIALSYPNDIPAVQTQNIASLANNDNPKNTFGPQSQNLPSIIRGFKIGVTKLGREINPNFAWQPRYHDHIIRNQPAHERIANYILNNPANWEKDKFHQ